MRRAAAALAALACGCMPETVVPPVTPTMLASPDVLARGRTGIQGSLAGRVGTGTPAMDTWTVRARHGFGDAIEASIEASYFNDVAGSRFTPASASGETLRLGVRFGAVRGGSGPLVTLFAGAGGGAFDHGGMLGGDVGLVLGNDTVFFAARGWVSGAFGAAIVDDGDYTEPQFCILFCAPNPPVHYRNTPRLAGGLDTMLGLHGRLGEWQGGALELVIAGGPVQVFAAQYHLAFTGGAAFEYLF